ncbi:AMP-binding protein, partial [Corynebacterium variabile]
MDEQSVALSKSGISFIDATTEMFTPLTCGAALVSVGHKEAKDPDALLGTIQRRQVTHLLTVPSLADVLIGEAASDHKITSITHWTMSGEALSTGTARRIGAQCPQVVLHDFYGSTEVAGDVISHTIPDGMPDEAGTSKETWLT